MGVLNLTPLLATLEFFLEGQFYISRHGLDQDPVYHVFFNLGAHEDEPFGYYWSSSMNKCKGFGFYDKIIQETNNLNTLKAFLHFDNTDKSINL